MIDIYPAIDIYRGQAVSLIRGDISTREEYGNPLPFAEKFSKISGKLHIIDLEGAFTGVPVNMNAISGIRASVPSFIQAGGGFRTQESIKTGYSAGLDSVIIGSAALDRKFLEDIASKFKNITVSIDAYNGLIKYGGWNRVTTIDYRDFYSEVSGLADRFIFTSIDRDGTGSISNIQRFWDSGYFIYAGGVGSIHDIYRIEKAGFDGVIIGKALYRGDIDVEELICLQKE
ncbi:MAG: HisA/HisF-related TIM barrel protein [Ferroplasma sp.]|uniref:HisA/HisF-related TIM barrel protein n=1 Tax=Ferroplasma sp. TaxID=2591003 RepID=UPI002814BEA0|nr:HisA/HisF-related TIM barrel protein [Ferroplasma sp.]WMT51125.1 MAG: HisA/HisF-related TIM barrel protein [Ferroplasma sp.]